MRPASRAAVALEGQPDGAAVVVGEVRARVLLLVDRDALGHRRLAQGAEVQRLAVHEHAVEVEDGCAHSADYLR